MPTRMRSVSAAYAAAIVTPSSKGLPPSPDARRSATQTASQPSSSRRGPRRRSSAGGGIPCGLSPLATNPKLGVFTSLAVGLSAGYWRGSPIVVELLPVQAVARSEQLGALWRIWVPGTYLELVPLGILEVDRHRFHVQVRPGPGEGDAHPTEVLAHPVQDGGRGAEGKVRPVALAVAVGEAPAVVRVANLKQDRADMHEDVGRPAALAEACRIVDVATQRLLVKAHGSLDVSNRKGGVIHARQSQPVHRYLMTNALVWI